MYTTTLVMFPLCPILFPNALMRIIIWLCYQPLLGRHFAGSTVLLVFTLHLIPILTIFAV